MSLKTIQIEPEFHKMNALSCLINEHYPQCHGYDKIAFAFYCVHLLRMEIKV